MVKVSVVAPVYGVEKYIDKFLESIKNLTFKDIEVILVDDGSPDKCPEILDQFAKTDDRYKVIHQENAGVAAARNIGIENAIGEYVYIVDSDDWLEPDSVENLYNEAIRTGADLIYGDWVREKDTGESTRLKCFPKEFVTSNSNTIEMLACGVFSNNNPLNIRCPEFEYINHLGGAPWRALIRLSIIKDNNLLYDSKVKGLGDDILFSLNLYEYIKKVAYIQKPIYHYRVVTLSYSHGYKADYIQVVDRILQAMEEFITKNGKNENFMKFYYYRVLLYLNQGVNRYFKNDNNPMSKSQRYREFKRVINRQPYKKAIKEAPINVIRKKKSRYAYLLLRLKLSRIYWMLK